MRPMISYAQNFEDVMLRRALIDVEEGFYVDVGAWDPNVETVTRHFYEQGWSGVNIEPISTYHSLYEQSRPRDVNLFLAVSNVNGRTKMKQVDGTGMSAITLSPAVRKAGYTDREIEVELRTLNSIFDEFAPPVVHFLKIDCEGSEADVINSFDLNRHRPWIILVEAIAPLTCEPNHTLWEGHLLAADYRFVYFDGINRFYAVAEQPRLAEAFKVPPNVFDNFKAPNFAPTVISASPPRKSWFRRLFSN